MVESKTFGSSLGRVIVRVVIVFVTIMSLLPIIHTLALSFSSKNAVVSGAVTFWPVDFSTAAYEGIIRDPIFKQTFLNSIWRVLLGTLINTVMTVSLAFPLSRSRSKFPQRNVYMWYIIVTMLVSGGLIPSYMLIKELGMLDTIWALVLPGAVPIFNVLVLMNYFRGLPAEIEEAAIIDGANAWTVITRLFLPLALPSLATVTLFAVIGHWNAFFDGVIYINSADKKPLQTYLQSLIVDQSQFANMSPEQRQRLEEMTGKNLNAAKMLVSTIPILLIYPLMQRYFVSGLVLGSVKS